METFLKILTATAILGVLIAWITYGILAWLREFAPWLLTERRLGFEMPPPLRKKTRLVPRGSEKKPAAPSLIKPKTEFSHLPKFARRTQLTGSARPERNWIS